MVRQLQSIGLPLSLAASNSFFVLVTPLLKCQGGKLPSAVSPHCSLQRGPECSRARPLEASIALSSVFNSCVSFALQIEPRVLSPWMPILRLISPSTTCSDLYAAVEAAFFTSSAPSDSAGEEQASTPPSSQADEQAQQKSKISGVFTQAVEAINKTFGPANADPNLRKWRLQVVSSLHN